MSLEYGGKDLGTLCYDLVRQHLAQEGEEPANLVITGKQLHQISQNRSIVDKGIVDYTADGTLGKFNFIVRAPNTYARGPDALDSYDKERCNRELEMFRRLSPEFAKAGIRIIPHFYGYSGSEILPTIFMEFCGNYTLEDLHTPLSERAQKLAEDLANEKKAKELDPAYLSKGMVEELAVKGYLEPHGVILRQKFKELYARNGTLGHDKDRARADFSRASRMCHDFQDMATEVAGKCDHIAAFETFHHSPEYLINDFKRVLRKVQPNPKGETAEAEEELCGLYRNLVAPVMTGGIAQKVCHFDLIPSNIVVDLDQKEPRFTLIDLARCGVGNSIMDPATLAVYARLFCGVTKEGAEDIWKPFYDRVKEGHEFPDIRFLTEVCSNFQAHAELTKRIRLADERQYNPSEVERMTQKRSKYLKELRTSFDRALKPESDVTSRIKDHGLAMMSDLLDAHYLKEN